MQVRLQTLGAAILLFATGVAVLIGLMALILFPPGRPQPDVWKEYLVVLAIVIALFGGGVFKLRRHQKLVAQKSPSPLPDSDMAFAGRAALHAIVVIGATVGIPVVCSWVGYKISGDDEGWWRGLCVLGLTVVGMLIGVPLAINIHYRQCPRCWRLSAARLMGTDVLGVTSGHRTEVRRDMIYTPTMHLIARVWREERVAVTDTALKHRLCCRFCAHEWSMRTNVRQDA